LHHLAIKTIASLAPLVTNNGVEYRRMIITVYSPPKSSIWGHAPRKKDLADQYALSAKLIGMHSAEQYSSELSIELVDTGRKTECRQRIEAAGEILERSPDTVSDGDNYLSAKWNLSNGEDGAVERALSSICRRDERLKITVNHVKWYAGRWLDLSGGVLEEYSAFAKIDLPQLPSHLTYAIGNYPYVTTGYVFPFLPETEVFKRIWGQINGYNYIALNSAHLKCLKYNQKTKKWNPLKCTH
jgi:hypothetical protein